MGCHYADADYHSNYTKDETKPLIHQHDVSHYTQQPAAAEFITLDHLASAVEYDNASATCHMGYAQLQPLR